MDTLPYSHSHGAEIEVPGFQIQELIGEGGMASVYLAIQESLGRQVALKILGKVDNPAYFKRALNEGRIIASLSHRNVITIYDIGSVEGRHYISMEYLEGGDLAARINGSMTEEQVLDVVEKIGDCLTFVHQQGVIHRDLKPENILFRNDEEPILTDFGIAKEVQGDGTMTLDGTVLGTPHYLSPEQATGKAVDKRSDIYGLGIIFFEMLTGRKPYVGDSYVETIMAHVNEPVPGLPLSLIRYQELLERMIAKDREDRFSTTEELVDGLRMLRSGVQPTIAAMPRILRTPDQGGAVEMFVRSKRLVASRARELWRGGTTITRRWLSHAVQYVVPTFMNPQVRITVAGSIAVLFAIALSGLPDANRDETGSEQDQVLTPPEHGIVPLPMDPPAIAVSDPIPTPSQATESERESVPQATDESALTVEQQLERQLDQQLAQQVEEYLLLARQAFEKNRLTTPEPDNAHNHYLAALSLDAGNERALAGLAAIVDRYANLAERDIGRVRYRRARVYVSRGLSVQPDNERLLALERRLNTPDSLGSRLSAKIKSLFR